MKIYYFHYRDADDKFKTEAFTTKVGAERRISEMKKETKTLRQRMQDYVIGNKRGERPPNYIRELPSALKTAEFERDNQGIFEAFTYFLDKE